VTNLCVSKGNFGKVFKGVYTDNEGTRQEVAIKVGTFAIAFSGKNLTPDYIRSKQHNCRVIELYHLNCTVERKRSVIG
jgi:hypothetical protein